MWSMTNTPNLATALPLELVGTAAVVDLEAACELFGCETLPYPLGRSRPVGSVWLLTRDVGPIEDRLDGGDLRGLRTWVEAVARAEMWVGCRVSYRDDDIPDLRLNGVRTDEVAFIAVQRNHPEVVDIVDVYAVSSADLGAVVADSVGLVRAGVHPRIAVSGCGDRLPAPTELMDEYDNFGFPIPPAGPSVRAVDGRDVEVIGTLESLCGPARHWVRPDDDGDYLYVPGDAGFAEPLDAGTLRSYIDGLIGNADADIRTDTSVGWDE